ncbi:MAG: response regulator [Limisphaerales bacterium]
MNTTLPELNRTRRPHWMLVDDDEGNLNLMGRLLRHYCEAEVECFHDSEAALAAFTSAPETFDLIVTDLQMPGMDGVELCRRVHAVSPPVKILLATGSGDITCEHATRAGFCGLLRKPFLIGALLGALEATGKAGQP